MGPSCRAQDTSAHELLNSTRQGHLQLCKHECRRVHYASHGVGSGDGLFKKDTRRNGVLMTLSIQRWDEGWAGQGTGQGQLRGPPTTASCTQSWAAWGPETKVASFEGQRGVPGTVPTPCTTQGCRERDYGTPNLCSAHLRPFPAHLVSRINSSLFKISSCALSLSPNRQTSEVVHTNCPTYSLRLPRSCPPFVSKRCIFLWVCRPQIHLNRKWPYRLLHWTPQSLARPS